MTMLLIGVLIGLAAGAAGTYYLVKRGRMDVPRDGV